MSPNLTQAFLEYSVSARASGDPIRWTVVGSQFQELGISGNRRVVLTETIALVGNCDLKVDTRQVRVMDIRLMGQTRGHALTQVEQIKSSGEAGITAAGDEYLDGECRGGHGGYYLARGTKMMILL